MNDFCGYCGSRVTDKLYCPSCGGSYEYIEHANSFPFKVGSDIAHNFWGGFIKGIDQAEQQKQSLFNEIALTIEKSMIPGEVRQFD